MEKENNKNWYILFVRGGHERQIINNIYNLIKNGGFESEIFEVKMLEKKADNGKIKNIPPSYIFANCSMNEKVLSFFYSIPGIISFLNHNRNEFSKMPFPLSTLETNNLLLVKDMKNVQNSKRAGYQKPQNKEIKPDKVISLKVGDLILIKDGFFKDNRGPIVRIDHRKEQVTLDIDFFGRLTPVSVNFSECEKI